MVSRGSREGIVGEMSHTGYSPMTMERGKAVAGGGNKEQVEESTWWMIFWEKFMCHLLTSRSIQLCTS
jgi:hypothetical protein